MIAAPRGINVDSFAITVSGNHRCGGVDGFAELKTGGLERSNVNVTDELTAMIKAQQQFNGSARLMQANSDMVEKLTR